MAGEVTQDEIARMGGGTVNLSIWSYIKKRHPDAVLTSAKTDHGVDGGYHPKGMAVDIGANPAVLQTIWAMRNQLIQIIHKDPRYNWYNVNGERAEGQAAVQIYGQDEVNAHSHYHVAAAAPIDGSFVELNGAVPVGDLEDKAEDLLKNGTDAVGLNGLIDAFGKMNDVFQFLRKPENWKRIISVYAGAVFVIIAVIMILWTVISEVFKDGKPEDIANSVKTTVKKVAK